MQGQLHLNILSLVVLAVVVLEMIRAFLIQLQAAAEQAVIALPLV
jgi:hypothetical protein